MNEVEDHSHGERLLSAVERILADSDTIIGLVEEHKRRFKDDTDPERRRALAAQALVRTYSNLSMVSGGATALPAVLPGLGTLVAVAGGTLVDMALVLKFEVEMALALSSLFGFDIRREDERQIAFLLASVSTYEAKSGRNFFVDLAEAEGVAIWTYGPRQSAKLLVVVLSKIAVLSIGKGFARAIPLVGVGIGAGINKTLTTRVGKNCITELERRRALADHEEEIEIVEARVDRRRA